MEIRQLSPPHYWPLDGLRGIAALSVAAAHFLGLFYPSTIFGTAAQSHGQWEQFFYTTPLIFFAHGELAVCIFFVMSGFVLTTREINGAQPDRLRVGLSFAKRPVRLGGMVLATVLLSFALKKMGCYAHLEVAELTGAITYAKEQMTFTPEFESLAKDLILRPFSSSAAYNSPLWSIRDELWGSWLVFAILFMFQTYASRWIICFVLLLVFSGNHIQGMLLGLLMSAFVRSALYRKLLGKRIGAPLCLALGVLFAT